MNATLLSLVVPVFNEEQVLNEFYDRVSKTLHHYDFEILFVDDGSTDRSWEIISSLANQDHRVRALRFSRNFGHQPALTAGLEHAKGDGIVIMDCDLQDPPELIPAMIEKWQMGFDVVYGVRSERRGEGAFKKMTATLFYLLFRKASRLDVPLEAGDFRLMSRRVVQILNQIPERIRFLRGLTSWVGFRQTGIPYTRDARFAGKTKYPLLRMFRFAFDGITSFSSIPLQFASIMGIVVTSVSFLVALHALYVRFVLQTAVKGWTSLLIVMIFLGGVQLLMIGIIGEYVGRIYQEIKHRPIYLLSDAIGFEGDALPVSLKGRTPD